MEDKLITEVFRITELMNTSSIISEAVAPSPGLFTALKRLVSNSSDETISKFITKTGIQSTDNAIDDIIKKLRNGEDIGKKKLNLLLSQINGNALAKEFVQSKKILGEDFFDSIIRYKEILKKQPDKYDEVIYSINTTIDNETYLKNLPENIKKALKLELKEKMDDTVKSVVSKKGLIPFNSLKRGNLDDIISGYKSGYRSSPDILKKIFSNITSLHWPTTKFTSQEYKQLLMWLSTGSSRMPKEILEIFKKQGFGPGIASFGGEFVKKYFTLLKYVVILRIAYGIIKDVTDGKENYPSNVTSLEIIWDRIRKAWYWPDAKWVVPVAITWPIFETVISPILRGNSPWGNIEDKLKSKIKEYEGEIDQMIDKTKTNVEDKKNQILNKIEDTEVGFKVFTLKNNLTIKLPYDGNSAQTNEPDPKNPSNFWWYYDKNKETFVSY
jgi:hypothetical protein